MNIIWGSPLSFQPNYWPQWLIIALLLIAGLLLLLAIHAFLRYQLAPKRTVTKESKLYLYPKSIRLWHWSNALLFILLLTTGLMNHFAIGQLNYQVELHKIAGYLLCVCWLFFIVVNFTSGNTIHYRINFSGYISRVIKQLRFYLFGIMKGEGHPFPATEKSKFNPIQQVAYIAILFLLIPALCISGILLLFPIAGAYNYLIFITHFILALISLAFLLVHIYLCTTGDTPTQTFKSMVDGYHRHSEDE